MDNSNESGFFNEMRVSDISWRDFFGSSLSLAPTLLSVYDELSMNSYKASCADEELENGNYTLQKDQTVPDHLFLVSSNELQIHDSVTEENKAEELPDNNNMNTSVENLNNVENSIFETESFAWTGPVNKIDHSNDSPLTLIHGNFSGDVDDKKRPLSVTSTSSSSSSTCPLACSHHRKKLASCTVTSCGVTLTLSPAAGDEVLNDSLATVSEISSGGSCTCNSSCCQAQDDCSVAYSGVQLDSCPSFTRERFRSFSGCSPLSPVDNSSWQASLPCAKSDSDVMVMRNVEEKATAAAAASVDNGQTSEQNEEKSISHSESQYIDRVVMEILETEQTYVRDLKDIIEGYVNYLCVASEFDLQPADQEALFGNIQDIYVFNRNFLKLLEEFGHDPKGVAECFVNQTEGFAIYSEYCTNYPRSMEVLTECMKDPVKASVLKRQQTALQHALPLGSYLLKPVQRILKYHLLLLNILNHHDVSSDGHKTIEQAVESMTSMARHINDMKQKHEHAIRTQEIQSMLYGWDGADLATLGDLILEDKFRICGVKAERNVFLFEKAVLIGKRREEGALIVKAFIMYHNLMLIESVPKEPLCFHMIPFDCPRIQYTVQARSLEQKRLWCQHLKQLILDNYTAAIPEKAKELVMTLGKSREEEMLEASPESLDHVRKQHSAPQYLQKWRGRRKSAGLIFDFKLKPRSGPRKSEPSAHGGQHSPPQVRRNSDVMEFLGEALKIKDKSGHSPRLGLGKKSHFWSKDGTEHSNLTLDTSEDSIKSSLAAHSAETVCSYSTPIQSTDTDSSAAETSDSMSVTEAAQNIPEHHSVNSSILKDMQGNATIRSTRIAHKDSLTLSKMKHGYASATLDSKGRCQKQCIKTKSKSVVGLDFQDPLPLSWSVTRKMSDQMKDEHKPLECGVTDSSNQIDFNKDKDMLKPTCSVLRVVLTSEDNHNTDLLADQCNSDENREVVADHNMVKDNEKLKCSDDGLLNHSRESDFPCSENEQNPVEMLTSSLCSKCGGNLLPLTFSVNGQYDRLSRCLCLPCASHELEMTNLVDKRTGNAMEGFGGDTERSVRRHDGKCTSEHGNVQLQLDCDLCGLKGDQLEEFANRLMMSQEMQLNRNCSTNAAVGGSIELENGGLAITLLPSAGSDECRLISVQKIENESGEKGRETHFKPEADSKNNEETDRMINGIVDSLRNTVVQFLSKLTNRNNASGPMSSKCSVDSARQNSEEIDVDESATSGTSHSNDIRYRFVYYLARAYSNRSKQLDVRPEVKSIAKNKKMESERDKGQQLSLLLKGKELGSEIIGERMAEASPHTLDRTLSLNPHRNEKRKGHAKRKDCSNVKETSLDKENSNQCLSKTDLNLHNEHISVQNSEVLDSLASIMYLDGSDICSSGQDSDEEKDAFESYYEKQLSLDLGEGSRDGSHAHGSLSRSESKHDLHLSHTL